MVVLLDCSCRTLLFIVVLYIAEFGETFMDLTIQWQYDLRLQFLRNTQTTLENNFMKGFNAFNQQQVYIIIP